MRPVVWLREWIHEENICRRRVGWMSLFVAEKIIIIIIKSTCRAARTFNIVCFVLFFRAGRISFWLSALKTKRDVRNYGIFCWKKKTKNEEKMWRFPFLFSGLPRVCHRCWRDDTKQHFTIIALSFAVSKWTYASRSISPALRRFTGSLWYGSKEKSTSIRLKTTFFFFFSKNSEQMMSRNHPYFYPFLTVPARV